MTDESTVFKLTFNKPAQRQFFDGPDVVGLRIKMDDNGVYFRPMASVRGPDTVRLVERKRGGHEVTVEGSMAQDLLDALMSEATAARPFFLLSRSSQKGWVECKFHNADTAPQKFSPHMRVWAPHEKVERPSTTDLDEETTAGLGEFSARVLDAHRIVMEHMGDRKIGRPPHDVRVARAIMGAFETLADAVLPNRSFSSADMKPMRDLRDRLDHLLGINDPSTLSNWRDIEAARLLEGDDPHTELPDDEEIDPPGRSEPHQDRKPRSTATKPAATRRGENGAGTRARRLADAGDTALLEDEDQPDLPLIPARASQAKAPVRAPSRASAAVPEVPQPVEAPPPAEEVPPPSPLPVSASTGRGKSALAASARGEQVKVRDDDAQLEPDFVQVASFAQGRATRSRPAQGPSRVSHDTQDKLAAGGRRRA